MSTFVDVLTTFAFMFWFMMFMMSPMMFDAPGSENDKSHLITMMLILCYPIVISLLYFMLGGQYFGISGATMIISSVCVVFGGFILFGYLSAFLTLQRGIALSGYSVADGKVYFDAKVVESADGDSFSEMPLKDTLSYRRNYYAKDDKHFFYEGKVVENVVPENLVQKMFGGDIYWMNDRQVIYGDKVLSGAIPANFGEFEDFQNWTYSDNSDGFRVYIYGLELPPVDKLSFERLSDIFSKDKDHIFEQNKIILEQADAPSFILLDGYEFGRDKDRVYYLNTTAPFALKGIDPETFEMLGSSYLKDGNGIYHVIQYESVEKLTDADQATFKVTNYDETTDSNARDKYHYFLNGKVVGSRD